MNFCTLSGASNASTYFWFHSTFKDLSNDTLRTQFRVKMKKLWPQQLKEEKHATKQKLCCDNSRLCRDKAKNFVTTNPDYVVINLEDKLCRNIKISITTKIFLLPQRFFYHNKDFFVTTEFFYRNRVFLLQQNVSGATKFFFVATEFFCRDKIFLSQESFSLS